MREHDAVAGTNDGLRINLPSETDTRTEVLIVIIDRRGAVASASTMACELQGTVDSCHRVSKRGTEEAAGVVDFCHAGIEVIAQTEIESEVWEDFPVVLNVRRDWAEACPELLL